MTWTTLLASHDVQRHRTSKRELDEIRAVIQRDLGDAQIAGLSADRRFAIAYTAALQTASMAIACAGYRVTAKAGHHRVTIDAITLTVANSGKRYAHYLETCRRKRNVIDYTRAHVATDSEADEIVKMATEFNELVEGWIESKVAGDVTMPLTREFKETVQARIRQDRKYRKELLRGGVESLLAGDLETGKAILRDYINATIGFEELSRVTKRPTKRLMRMFGPDGNPHARNLFEVIGHLQRAEGLQFELSIKAAS